MEEKIKLIEALYEEALEDLRADDDTDDNRFQNLYTVVMVLEGVLEILKS